MKMTTNGQSQSAKKVYQKATMEIVEIGAVDVLTSSANPGATGDSGAANKMDLGTFGSNQFEDYRRQ